MRIGGAGLRGPLVIRPPSWLVVLGGRLRRALLIGVHGAALGLLVFGFSRISGGLVAAGAFLFALFMIPLTAGAVVAAFVEAWQESPRERLALAAPGRGTNP